MTLQMLTILASLMPKQATLHTLSIIVSANHLRDTSFCQRTRRWQGKPPVTLPFVFHDSVTQAMTQRGSVLDRPDFRILQTTWNRDPPSLIPRTPHSPSGMILNSNENCSKAQCTVETYKEQPVSPRPGRLLQLIHALSSHTSP
jgi:hypothetical protein